MEKRGPGSGSWNRGARPRNYFLKLWAILGSLKANPLDTFFFRRQSPAYNGAPMRCWWILAISVSLCTAAIANDQPRSTDIGSGKPPAQGPIFKVGGPISPPRVKSAPDPQYSKEARHAHVQGVVVLRMVVGVDGRAQQVKVSRSLGYGLDEEAVKAVQKWRFEPAKRKGKPVPVQINVEVNFRL